MTDGELDLLETLEREATCAPGEGSPATTTPASTAGSET